MKEITIIRHAKSDWGDETMKDVDRHLNERGINDSYFMSEWYAKNNSKPDLILSSTATRALSTALIFARQIELGSEQLILEPKIYEANVTTLYSVLRSQNENVNSLILFGHNPGLTDLCNELSTDLFFDNLPTCAIASYQFNVKSWKEIGPKKGKINYYQFPKNFKS